MLRPFLGLLSTACKHGMEESGYNMPPEPANPLLQGRWLLTALDSTAKPMQR